MFEPEEQPTSSTEPGQEEGGILQRYLSQLGMPQGTGLPRVNDSPINLRLPRYYGAPPDHSPSSTSTLNSPQSEGPGNDMERVRFLLKMPDSRVRRSSVPIVGRDPTQFSALMKPGIPDSNNSGKIDRPVYAIPEANRFFSTGQVDRPISRTDLWNRSDDTRTSRPSESRNLGGRSLAVPATSDRSWANASGPSLSIGPSSKLGNLAGFARGTQSTNLVADPANQQGSELNTDHNSTEGTSIEPQSGKNTKAGSDTQPVADSPGHATNKTGNGGTPAAPNGGRQAGAGLGKQTNADSFPVVNPYEAWKNSDKQYSIPKLKGTVGGTGAKNDPTDVKLVQHLLNAAIIAQELPGMKTLPEDGKMSSETLKAIHEYDRTHGLLPFPSVRPEQLIIEPGKRIIAKMGANRLVDFRWSIYDDTIKRDVEYYNKHLRELYPDSNFKDLDWRLVKAMLWTEVQGPTHPEWWTRPMQIGNKGDRHSGIYTIMNGRERTNEYVPQDLRSGLRKSELGKMNVRAAIPYIVNRAIQEFGQVPPPSGDSGRQEMFTKEDGNLIKFARRVKTTVPQLYQDNPGLEGRTNFLRPNTPLKVRAAKESPVWREWNGAAKLYNNKTADHQNRVLRNYEMIKQVWPR